MKELTILVPVYNDWECLRLFCDSGIFKTLSPDNFEVVVVNDGSLSSDFNKQGYPFNIDIIHLHSNQGHQKAIAIGLSYIYNTKNTQKIIVMDADGEDNPAHITTLLDASSEKEGLISAKRINRKESLFFRTGYILYKLLFKILTGKSISFGNFVLIPTAYLSKLIYKNDIWNHLAAGIIKSDLPLTVVPIERNHRFSGHTKMNFHKLLLHGLGAIVVFIERVSTRLLIFSLLLLALTSLAIISIFSIKLFTDWAIPGWASTLTGVILILLLQSFLLTLFTLFLYLTSQSQRQSIPGIHYKAFISNSRKV